MRGDSPNFEVLRPEMPMTEQACMPKAQAPGRSSASWARFRRAEGAREQVRAVWSAICPAGQAGGGERVSRRSGRLVRWGQGSLTEGASELAGGLSSGRSGRVGAGSGRGEQVELSKGGGVGESGSNVDGCGEEETNQSRSRAGR